jgi:hypothetical protein
MYEAHKFGKKEKCQVTEISEMKNSEHPLLSEAT